KETARREADESLRLQPDLGEGHLALGLYFYYEEGNYEEALRELNLAAKTLPNDGDVGLYIAAVQRRQGDLTQAIAAYQKAEGIVTFSRWDVALIDRDPDAAELALTSARLENFVAPTGVPLPKSYLAGCVALMRNDTALAQQEFETARPILEQVVMKSPQDGVRHAQLGL